MNRQELVELLVKDKNTGFESKAAADRALKAVINGITEAIKKDGSLQLVGFGTFSVRSRPARKGRNPLTGEEIKIKASKNVGFKAGAALKAVAAKCKIK